MIAVGILLTGGTFGLCVHEPAWSQALMPDLGVFVTVLLLSTIGGISLIIVGIKLSKGDESGWQ